ncbi:hypothetical protein TNIN_91421 [Trichonephila inaurata madagascariensis]|uniref:Uncharacterized protein n=1 Tax=Trichonephila inaurata madagascariensis TaxID=2747483 RepID=A0A8X6YVZ3_9ARAC|nr:hypothetical protein TNIN_91421 [Trichonephila inaurata madagascariensis]
MYGMFMALRFPPQKLAAALSSQWSMMWCKADVKIHKLLPALSPLPPPGQHSLDLLEHRKFLKCFKSKREGGGGENEKCRQESRWGWQKPCRNAYSSYFSIQGRCI